MGYELTKLDIAALRGCDRVRVSLWGAVPTVVVERRGDGPTEANPFGGSDGYYTLQAEVRLTPKLGFRRVRASAESQRCVATLWVYRDQKNHEASILATLRVGDEIRFDFFPDAGTTSDLSEVHLHQDKLFLTVFRAGKHVAEFEIAESVRSGTGRMCNGIASEGDVATARLLTSE